MRLEMEADIAGKQQHDQHHHGEISPVAAGNDLARRSGSHQQQKAGIDQHRHEPACLGGKRHAEPSGDPDDQSVSGVPWIGNRPVQFGIAVNRKPVMTAGR